MDQIDYLNTILVVDDEPFVLRTTATVSAGWVSTRVETADNVDVALKIIASANPQVDLVLSDLNMPGIDGLELLKRFDEMDYRGDILLFSGEDSQTLSMAESLARARGLSVIGAIAKPVQADKLLEILSKSSHSMKPSKQKSAGDVCVTAEMLDAAIDAGELQPWFQPKIDIASRTPVGVEGAGALAEQYQRSDFPDTFIPVAEEHGLIDKLTFSLIEQAVKIDNEWREQGIELKIAFNISMDSLQDTQFPDTLERKVNAAGGNLARFQLEVTESRLMKDLVRPLEALLRLRMKKVRLSIDDFGTGHSNLSQLRDLPFDELKLDRSYIQTGANGERTDLILESTVEMARKLGMSIVAEGIENLDEWKRVEQLGCDQVQGYFAARPMPGREIADWMALWPSLCQEMFGG